MPSCDGHQFDPCIPHQVVRMSGGDFRRSKIVGHYKGLEGRVRSTAAILPGCLPFAVECSRKSLTENFRFQRCGLLWVRLVRPRVGSGGSDPGFLAEKLLTNEQDCRARGEEQRARRSGEGGEEKRAGAPKDSPRVKAVIAAGYGVLMSAASEVRLMSF